MGRKNFTRREFIGTIVLATAGGITYLNSPQMLFAQLDSKTKVVLIRNKDVLDEENEINADVLQRMLDKAVSVLFEVDDPMLAWKQIIRPEDIVGIKSNVWSYLPTPEELEQAIKKRVMAVGVAEENISIRDRGILRDPIFKKATALINTRPMRTHYWSGVGSLLKNYITFVESPSDYHGDSCADLAVIWKMPHVKGKTRLNILVMLTPQFHNVGPHGFNKKYVWNYYGLIVGVDPVACDAIGLKIIQAKRKEYFGEDRPISPPAKHINIADTRHHLGTADMNKIELIRLGWEENILI